MFLMIQCAFCRLMNLIVLQQLVNERDEALAHLTTNTRLRGADERKKEDTRQHFHCDRFTLGVLCSTVESTLADCFS